MIFFFQFQLTDVVGAPRQTNCSTRSKVVQNIRKNCKGKVSDRQLRRITKHHKDSTLNNYDIPPDRAEKLMCARAIAHEETVGDKVLFYGKVDDCPQEVRDEIQEEVKLVEQGEATEKMITNDEEVDPEKEKTGAGLDDSFLDMFTQHEEEFNERFDFHTFSAKPREKKPEKSVMKKACVETTSDPISSASAPVVSNSAPSTSTSTNSEQVLALAQQQSNARIKMFSASLADFVKSERNHMKEVRKDLLQGKKGN